MIIPTKSCHARGDPCFTCMLPSVLDVQGSGFSVQSSGFRVSGSWLLTSGSWFTVHGTSFEVPLSCPSFDVGRSMFTVRCSKNRSRIECLAGSVRTPSGRSGKARGLLQLPFVFPTPDNHPPKALFRPRLRAMGKKITRF